MSMSNEVKGELKARLIQAQSIMDQRRGGVLNALDKIYVDPHKAYKAMQNFMKSNTEEALMQRLEKEPYRFGGLRGHFLSGSKWTPFGGDKAIAKEELKTLPALVKGTLDAEREYRSIETAYHDQTPGPFGPDRGRGGPSLG
jgi:hypothetical protein